MTVSTVRPWRTALQRERSLPSSVVGPVLFRALRRLASICLRELMGYSTHKIGFVLLVANTLQSGLQCHTWSKFKLPPRPTWLCARGGSALACSQLSLVVLAEADGCTSSATADLGCVCSHSPLATSSGLMLSFSHQAGSLPV